MFYRTLSPLGPLPCLPSPTVTNILSRATGITDHILPLGDWLIRVLWNNSLFYSSSSKLVFSILVYDKFLLIKCNALITHLVKLCKIYLYLLIENFWYFKRWLAWNPGFQSTPREIFLAVCNVKMSATSEQTSIYSSCSVYWSWTTFTISHGCMGRIWQWSSWKEIFRCRNTADEWMTIYKA